MGPGFSQKLFLEKFAVGRINYWISFGSDSFLATFFTLYGIMDRRARLLEVALCFAAGFFAWGFSEYAFHRWAYHQERGVFGAGHRLHHQEEKGYVAMPWFISGLVMFGVWCVFARVLNIPGASEVLGGWMAGFVLYSWMHHAVHHWKPRGSWMRRMAAYHRVHHRFPAYNYGVTMRLWDTLLGTRFKGDRRR